MACQIIGLVIDMFVFLSRHMFSILAMVWFLSFMTTFYLGSNYIEENYESFFVGRWILFFCLFSIFFFAFIFWNGVLRELVIAPVVLGFLYTELFLVLYPLIFVKTDDCKPIDGYFYLDKLPRGIGVGISSYIDGVGYVYAPTFSYSQRQMVYEYEKVPYRGMRCGSTILFDNVSQEEGG